MKININMNEIIKKLRALTDSNILYKAGNKMYNTCNMCVSVLTYK